MLISLTLSSPNCESLNLVTASYSYSPCVALVVDFICHSISLFPNDSATSIASKVLPVPGSPLINKGLSRVTDALTAILRSSVETYFLVPLNFITYPYCYIKCGNFSSDFSILVSCLLVATKFLFKSQI